MEGSAAEPARGRMAPGTVTALVALSLAIFIVANDFTAVTVALPDMERDLDTDLGTVQWVINAYALTFGVFIVTAGRLADLFGRRELFFAAASLFAVFSFLGGLAQEPWQVIACRVGMAFGGATIWTASLGMVYAALPEDRAGLAGGIVLGVAGIGNAAGPLIGGGLTEAFSWRAIFFVNVPICLLAMAVVWLKVHQPKPRRGDEKLDVPGSVTLSIGLVALLVALDQVVDWGWVDWRIIALLAVFAAFLVAFVVIERRAGSNALVPRDVIGNPAFRSVFVAVLLMSAVFFVSLLYLPQYFQKVLDFNALEAGAALLPFMLLFAVTSFVAGSLYERVGAKAVTAAGSACLVIGLFLCSLPGAGSGYAAMVPGMVGLGLGAGLFYSSVTTAGVTALDPSRTSLAGGIVYMAQVAGGAVGLGIATTIFSTVSLDEVKADAFAGRLPESGQRAVDNILAGTETGRLLQAQLPAWAERLEALAREAFVAGMQTSFRVFAAVALLGFVVTLVFVGGRLGRRGSRPAQAAG